MTKCFNKKIRQDGNHGELTFKWLSPYTVANISETGLRILMNEKDETLQKNTVLVY